MTEPQAQCKPGLIVPALPSSTPTAMIYLFFLLYCFLGTAIIADIFMCAIERITSTTKKVKKHRVHRPLIDNGEKIADQATPECEEYEYIKVWNPTVANLTLMALGSSAPEILLSLIEIIGNDFKAGDLGPGTIVGSAAFNLFCISAICVVAVKSPTVKRIDQLSVFCITSAFSVFAYVWILFILVVSSPNVIDIWEAALTLAFFFALVLVAYAFDVQLWRRGKASDSRTKRAPVAVDCEIEGGEPGICEISQEVALPDIATVARLYPSLSPEDQAKILAYRINQAKPHDRAYYRIKSIRQLTSSWRESQTEREVEKLLATTNLKNPSGKIKPRIEWSARAYGVRRVDKKIQLTIVRRGPCTFPITVSYHTVNGSAKKGQQLEMGQRFKVVELQLIEGAEWKADAVFYVHLKIQDQEDDDRTKLGCCNVSRIRLVESAAMVSRHPSVEFAKQNYVIAENAGWVRVLVRLKQRTDHASRCIVHFRTEDVSAEAGLDYVAIPHGRLTFEPEEIEKYVDIEIIDDVEDEKDETFLVTVTGVDERDLPLSPKLRTTVTIISDDNRLKNVTNVRKLMRNYLKGMTLQRASWTEQILHASSVNGGDISNATFCDAIKHGIAFPWKFVFAFVPPPEILGGWPCFFVALALIGVVTAIIGDLASIFGCMMGIGDAVTAITLVALGTSLPDTFASKIAAEQDKTADNAVGNITGSNSVNVFLGLGLPWLVASIYWATKGERFIVEAGDLTYSVTLFTLLSLVCLAVLTARRLISFLGKGELGGPRLPKALTALLFVSLWLVYIVLSVMDQPGIVLDRNIAAKYSPVFEIVHSVEITLVIVGIFLSIPLIWIAWQAEPLHRNLRIIFVVIILESGAIFVTRPALIYAQYYPPILLPFAIVRIQSFVFFAVIMTGVTAERLIATFYWEWYEKQRSSTLLVVGAIFAILGVFMSMSTLQITEIYRTDSVFVMHSVGSPLAMGITLTSCLIYSLLLLFNKYELKKRHQRAANFYCLARTYQLKENVVMMEMIFHIMGPAFLLSIPAFIFRGVYMFLPDTLTFEFYRSFCEAMFDLWISLVSAIMVFAFPLFNYRFRKPASRVFVYRKILELFNRRASAREANSVSSECAMADIYFESFNRSLEMPDPSTTQGICLVPYLLSYQTHKVEQSVFSIA